MSIKRYVGDFFDGTSSDTKPTNVSNGAKFLELDTKTLYVLVNGIWEEFFKVQQEHEKAIAQYQRTEDHEYIFTGDPYSILHNSETDVITYQSNKFTLDQSVDGIRYGGAGSSTETYPPILVEVDIVAYELSGSPYIIQIAKNELSASGLLDPKTPNFSGNLEYNVGRLQTFVEMENDDVIFPAITPKIMNSHEIGARSSVIVKEYKIIGQ